MDSRSGSLDISKAGIEEQANNRQFADKIVRWFLEDVAVKTHGICAFFLSDHRKQRLLARICSRLATLIHIDNAPVFVLDAP